MDASSLQAVLTKHGGNKTAAGLELGWGRDKVRRAMKRLGIDPKGVAQPAAPKLKSYKREKNGYLEVRHVGIGSLEELMQHYEIDPDVYEEVPGTFEVRHYNQNTGADAHGLVGSNYVKCRFRRRGFLDPMVQGKRFLEMIEAKSAKVAKLKLPKAQAEGDVLVICLYDMHVGKHAFHRERGETWGTEESFRVGMQAIAQFADYAKRERVRKIVLPWGQDMGNVDNLEGGTTKGTPQLGSSPLWEQRKALEEFSIQATTELAKVAPVEVIEISGNHDRQSSAHMAAFIDAWHRNNPNVTVDREPFHRKYRRYGVTCVGFGHLDNEPRNERAALIQSEATKGAVHGSRDAGETVLRRSRAQQEAEHGSRCTDACLPKP